MPDSVDPLLDLISARVHHRGTLMVLTDSPTARRFELRPPRPGAPLKWSDQDEVTKLVYAAAQAGHFLALITDGSKTGDAEPQPLAEKEIRFFRPHIDPKTAEFQLTQASRLHASILLTRLQMRGMMPRDLTPFGPHLGYQQLYLATPFF